MFSIIKNRFLQFSRLFHNSMRSKQAGFAHVGCVCVTLHRNNHIDDTDLKIFLLLMQEVFFVPKMIGLDSFHTPWRFIERFLFKF